jgi:hypothetical protein
VWQVVSLPWIADFFPSIRSAEILGDQAVLAR